jgi:hypothetical protein
VRRANAWLVLSLCVVLAACGLWRRAKNAVTPRSDPPEAIRWNGVLFAPTDTLADTTSTPYGTAWMAPVSANNQLIRVRVALVRARPNARYDWRIHLGKCAHDRGVFGPPSGYPILVVDSTGHAVGNTVLQLGFPNRGAYFVRVEAVDSGATDRFCGTLIPPG